MGPHRLVGHQCFAWLVSELLRSNLCRGLSRASLVVAEDFDPLEEEAKDTVGALVVRLPL